MLSDSDKISGRVSMTQINPTSSAMTAKEIRLLEAKILWHKKLYYAGTPEISDSEYDALEDHLQKIHPQSPALQWVGAPIDALESTDKKVGHNPPMLSLAKTYSVADLLRFLDDKTFVLSDKIDGMALSLEYNLNTGVLETASTRGNGAWGENVTQVVRFIPHIPIKIPGLLHLGDKKIEEHAVFEVRGEVYFPKSHFKNFTDLFDSPRNAVPGIFGRKEINARCLEAISHLEFQAYDCLVRSSQGIWDLNALYRLLDSWRNESLSKQESLKNVLLPQATGSSYSFLFKLGTLENLGFQTGIALGRSKAMPQLTSPEDLAPYLQQELNTERDYLIDGLVVRLNDDVTWHEWGNTSHHPRGSLAFKQANETALTRITEIEWSVGRTGKISFRAKLDPVTLSGATLTYASLHNAQFVEQGPYAVGALVKIQRSGEVIPSILGCEIPSETAPSLPELCPCGYALIRKGPDLICNKKENCIHKSKELFTHFVKAIGIKGLSDKIIGKLWDAGMLREPADFFKLQATPLADLNGLGKRSAEIIIAEISDHATVTLSQFLWALGLARGGAVKCKQVAQFFNTWERLVEAQPADLLQISGWAQKSAEDFMVSLQEKRPWADALLQHMRVLPQAEANPNAHLLPKQDEDAAGRGDAATATRSPSSLAEKTLCITGKLSLPRREIMAQAEGAGMRVVSQVSSQTDYLLCNEPSESSKYRAALSLGVPIVTELEWADMISGAKPKITPES